MPNPISLEKLENIISLLSAELAQRVVKVKFVSAYDTKVLYTEKKKKKKKKKKSTFMHFPAF